MAAADKPHNPASQVRLTLRMRYTEICDVLQADELNDELWAGHVITQEDYENLEREKDRRGVTSQVGYF